MRSIKNVVCLTVTAFFCQAAISQSVPDTAAVLTQNKGIYSLVINQHQHTVYTHYYNGKTADSLFNSQSLTKSVVSVLIGIAIDKGYIRSVDEPLADYFPELRKDADPRKAEITIRQVMNQASGLYHEDLGAPGGIGAYLSLDNPSGYVLNAPLQTAPGAVFHYSNAASHLLSVLLTKATHQSTLQFAEQYLFKPLGIRQYRWDKMRDGYYDGSGLLSLHMRTEDMMLIGRLLLQGGVANGRQLVSAKWISELLQPAVHYNTNWGFAASTYALCWYHAKVKGVAITYGMGWGGQFLIVIPGYDAVVAVHESHEDATAIAQAEMFTQHIFPLVLQVVKR